MQQTSLHEGRLASQKLLNIHVKMTVEPVCNGACVVCVNVEACSTSSTSNTSPSSETPCSTSLSVYRQFLSSRYFFLALTFGHRRSSFGRLR